MTMKMKNPVLVLRKSMIFPPPEILPPFHTPMMSEGDTGEGSFAGLLSPLVMKLFEDPDSSTSTILWVLMILLPSRIV